MPPKITSSSQISIGYRGPTQCPRMHLKIAGVNKSLFDGSAITAIYQGSGGLLRKANHLARGALIAAANSQSIAVNAEHVRLAQTEIF